MSSAIIQLLVLAGIAVFLILRLRSVLGTRDGFEKPQGSLSETDAARRRGRQFRPLPAQRRGRAPAVLHALDLGVEAGAGLQQARVGKVVRHGEGALLVDFHRGQDRVHGGFHAVAQGGDRHALIGRVDRQPDQSQREHQDRHGGQDRAVTERRRWQADSPGRAGFRWG